MSWDESQAMRARRRRQLAARDAMVCRHCGATEDLTIDHIIPRSRGGSSQLSNLQWLCAACNQAKANT